MSRVVWLSTLVPWIARGMVPATLVTSAGAVDPDLLQRLRAEVGRQGVLVDPTPIPAGDALTADQVAAEERASAVRFALQRARKLESEAAWDDCVKEAAGAMGDAVDAIAYTDDLQLVRDLHVQAGACMSLAGEEHGARLHFLAAALLDETPAPSGLHREEAERLQRQAESEVTSRPKGAVRITTVPSGARVWIDGQVLQGTTPLEALVRLGDHFVTIRRFRYEQNTEQRFLQPSGVVRVVLEPAQRQTLGHQLANAGAGKLRLPSSEELMLSLASWSRAEQILVASTAQHGWTLGLIEVPTGNSLRTAALESSDESSVRKMVCKLLGSRCEADRSVGWYVWPLGAAALLGGVLAAGIVIDNGRSMRFCPPSGCR